MGIKEGQSAFIYGLNRDFHFDLAQVFDEKNWLDLNFLVVDDNPIAAMYSFDYASKKYGYNTGFDPEFAKYGIGNMLKNYSIEESIKKGLREYDLLRGRESYKSNWATGFRENFVARMANRSWRGSLFLQINKVKQHFKSDSN
ncbi:MAG: GNAT family N-acetyltransferase [Candidatus Thermoplasmatota archaeon]|nr:GNAT family N-acetyltransferase [Candidatus Thermoplasmatota archaeon]